MLRRQQIRHLNMEFQLFLQQKTNQHSKNIATKIVPTIIVGRASHSRGIAHEPQIAAPAQERALGAAARQRVQAGRITGPMEECFLCLMDAEMRTARSAFGAQLQRMRMEFEEAPGEGVVSGGAGESKKTSQGRSC